MYEPRWARTLRYAALVVLSALFLVPFYIIVRNAFSTSRWIASPHWHWLPNAFNADNLHELLANSSVRILRSMLVSGIVSVSQTVLTVVVAALAGYALARLGEGRLPMIILGLIIGTLMVPPAVTFVPSFVMVSSLGWIDSFRGLIIPGLFSAFAAFLFRQFFLGFPAELEEAARIDGAGYWATFWRVVMPNSLGIASAVGTIIFIGSWNAFLWPLLIGQSNAYRTVQVSLSTFMTSQGVDVPQLFTGALVAIVPVVAVFLFLQRYLVEGVERSGID